MQYLHLYKVPKFLEITINSKIISCWLSFWRNSYVIGGSSSLWESFIEMVYAHRTVANTLNLENLRLINNLNINIKLNCK